MGLRQPSLPTAQQAHRGQWAQGSRAQPTPLPLFLLSCFCFYGSTKDGTRDPRATPSAFIDFYCESECC